MYTQRVVEDILRKVSKGKISYQKAFQKLRHLSYESLGFANLDHHRVLRKNLPEVIYAPGKTIGQLKTMTKAFLRNGAPLLVTRLDPETFHQLKKQFPKLSYSREARAAYVNGRGKPVVCGTVAIVTAGTSDIPVAEEARLTLEVLGTTVKCFYDLGVAGLHRLLDHLPQIEKADVIICIAGMEGALASVLTGLVSKPVVAVPTSVGYGASFKGVAALLTMLNSCAQGVALVNIDSGFGAACFAHLILS